MMDEISKRRFLTVMYQGWKIEKICFKAWLVVVVSNATEKYWRLNRKKKIILDFCNWKFHVISHIDASYIYFFKWNNSIELMDRIVVTLLQKVDKIRVGYSFTKFYESRINICIVTLLVWNWSFFSFSYVNRFQWNVKRTFVNVVVYFVFKGCWKPPLVLSSFIFQVPILCSLF